MADAALHDLARAASLASSAALQEDLGLHIKVLDPTPGCPASSVAEQVQGSFTDPAAIAEFAKGVDLLTVEIEHVDADALEVRGWHARGWDSGEPPP